jgi:alginate O-acetyltransferase complex protein AlgI
MLADASGQKSAERSHFLPVSSYLLLFPKAISGPITRFQEITDQMKKREISIPQTAAGIRRFMLGFAKKALIADQLALITGREIFSQSPLHLPAGLAWLALLCFTLQIYFDFSAYTDMAVGLGQSLGFDFGENFNYPYLSQSITEFWRRWHISLSKWFRDYVFYPLELKRRSIKWLIQPLNILVVFLLTGLWHGVTPPFIAWGLLQGAALVLESGRFGIWLKKLWRPLQNGYALSVIMLGWILFRSPTLLYAWNYLKALAGFSKPAAWLTFTAYPPVSPLVWFALAAGILFSFPFLPAFQKRFTQHSSPEKAVAWVWIQNALALALFAAGIIVQAGTSYLPFIYGEF